MFRVSRPANPVWGFGIVLLVLMALAFCVIAYFEYQRITEDIGEWGGERDRSDFDQMMRTHVNGLAWQAHQLVHGPDLQQALDDGSSVQLNTVLQDALREADGWGIDGLALESSGQLVAAPAVLASTLNDIVRGQQWTLGEWHHLSHSSEQGVSLNGLMLSLPVHDTPYQDSVEVLHVWVKLSGNHQLAEQLMKLLDASALMIGTPDGDVLAMAESAPGRLASLHDLVNDQDVAPQGAARLSKLTWSIGNSQLTIALLPRVLSLPSGPSLFLPLFLSAGGVLCLAVVLWIFVGRYLMHRTNPEKAELIPSTLKSEILPGRASKLSPADQSQQLSSSFIADSKRWKSHERDRLFASIIEHSPECIFVKDPNGYYRFANEQYARSMWTTPHSLIGKRDETMLPEDMLAVAQSSDEEVFKGHMSARYEFTIRTPDGTRTFLVHKFPISQDGQAPQLLGGIATDISELKQAQERLGLVQNVFAETSEAIVVLDEKRKALIVNRAFCELSGYEAPSATFAVQTFLKEHPDVAAQLEREQRWQGQCAFAHRLGNVQPVLVSITFLHRVSGGSRHVLRFNDITELKLAEHRLEHLAWYDQLTGLPNRGLFARRLEQALEAEDTTTAVLFIDLDDFKSVNDKFGHARGDQLLCQIAERLRTCIQHKDLVSRFGADEFTVLLSDVADEAHVMSVSSRLMNALDRPFSVGDETCNMTASIGITFSDCHGGTAETLLRNADQAMYEAKGQGRHRVVVFEPSIDARQQQRLSYEMSLRDALKKGELSVVYQPRFDIAGQHVLGAEALLRWESEEHGCVSPAVFIPIAEGTRLIVDIGRFVLEQACQQAAEWNRQGYPIPISVNLSPKQLVEGCLWTDIVSALKETGLPANMLELELTENVLVDNLELVLPLLERLRSLGVRVAIDDFGTGYSSLAYLKKLPVDTVKVDRSFVVDVPGTSDDETLLHAIVSMARSLKYRVVAEGVENEAQRELLASLGCDELQGFLFGRPEPARKLTERLQSSEAG